MQVMVGHVLDSLRIFESDPLKLVILTPFSGQWTSA